MVTKLQAQGLQVWKAPRSRRSMPSHCRLQPQSPTILGFNLLARLLPTEGTKRELLHQELEKLRRLQELQAELMHIERLKALRAHLPFEPPVKTGAGPVPFQFIPRKLRYG